MAYYITHFLVSGFCLLSDILNKANSVWGTGSILHLRMEKFQFLNCCILFEIQWTLSRNPKVTDIHKNLSTILAILNMCVCMRVRFFPPFFLFFPLSLSQVLLQYFLSLLKKVLLAYLQLKAIRNLKVIAVSVYLHLTTIKNLH